MKVRIGTNAGLVWAYLDNAGERSLAEIKKACKLTEKDLHAALGWLAREEKILFHESDSDIAVSLA